MGNGGCIANEYVYMALEQSNFVDLIQNNTPMFSRIVTWKNILFLLEED